MKPTSTLVPEIDTLLYKFTELLVGEATEENVEMVKVWALYTQMSKAMPPLVQHWNSLEEHQEVREKIKGIIEKVKQMNMELRQKK